MIQKGWTIEDNVCGIRGAPGPDIKATRPDGRLCVEVKGHAGNDLTDYKTAIGQLVINMCTEECANHAMAFPAEGYRRHVEKCVEWYRREHILVFLVKESGEVVEI